VDSLLITTEDKKLILDLAVGELSRDAFYRRYSVRIDQQRDYVLRMLLACLKNKDVETLEYIIYLRDHHRLIEPLAKHQAVLRSILQEQWHQRHELILDSLERDEDVETINAIFKTAITKFPYLYHDDQVALTIKCVYDLSKIDSEVAESKLEYLLDHPEESVREVVAQRLARIRSRKDT